MEQFLVHIDQRRKHAAHKLFERADVEDLVFCHYFSMWELRDKTTTRWGVAKITAQLNSKKLWARYCARIRHLAFNMRHNPELRTRDAQFLASASPWQLDPQKWVSKKNAQEVDWQRAEQEDLGVITENEQVSSFKCNRCHSYKVTYTQLQTRSADEGLTTFFYCENCGKRWRG